MTALYPTAVFYDVILCHKADECLLVFQCDVGRDQSHCDFASVNAGTLQCFLFIVSDVSMLIISIKIETVALCSMPVISLTVCLQTLH